VRVFSCRFALFLLEIHKVFPRRNALIGGKIPRPPAIRRLSVQVLTFFAAFIFEFFHNNQTQGGLVLRKKFV